jgi:hypothetical protein
MFAAAASTLVPEQGNFFQRQAMAVPEDMSDPLLKRWKKPDTNPFLAQVIELFNVTSPQLHLQTSRTLLS